MHVCYFALPFLQSLYKQKSLLFYFLWLLAIAFLFNSFFIDNCSFWTWSVWRWQ